jgi:hypothetical protein
MMQLIFYEAPIFNKYRENYLNDDQYRLFQEHLLNNPSDGDVIQGTGGFRKIRWSDPLRNKGKRGGLRIIYYYLENSHQIWLYTLYNKDEMSDLSPEQKASLKSMIELELKLRKRQ